MEYMKSVCLCVLSVQTASHVLMTRYTRANNNGQPYLPSTVVALVEVFKFLICSFLLFNESGSLQRFTGTLKRELFYKPKEALKMVVPAGLYVLQNNLLFLALSNLDSATYQVCYQTKILTTALFSVFMLKKKLRWTQWLSLLILTIGVALVQLVTTDSSKAEKLPGSPFVGMLAVIAAACTSGFSGVYFEMVLKGTGQSLWLRNIELAGFSVVIALTSVFVNDWNAVSSGGFLQGYTTAVWSVVALGVASGLVVSLVVKYADNILKGFAVSISILISTFISYYFLNDFEPSLSFLAGAALVILATFLYGMDFSKPSKKV